MGRLNVEFSVGIFMLMGMAAFFYLAINMGDFGFVDKNEYQVTARFESSSGLKVGANIELAGVKIGKVKNIQLDAEAYESVVKLAINNTVQIQEDSIASIRTSGIIGDKFIKISPGGLDDYIVDGGEITETESAISIEELVSKYIFDGNEEE